MNKKRNILIVEDDRAIRTTFQKLLEMHGYQVETATNGQEGIDFLKLKSSEINLILLDLMMPVKDGFKFREEQLQDSNLAAIPVIIMSADGRAEEKQRMTQSAGYLKKPIDIDKVFDLIEKLIA